MNVKIFTKIAQLRDLVNPWNELLFESSVYWSFFSPEWFFSLTNHFSFEPSFYSVWDRDRLLALLPLELSMDAGNEILRVPNEILMDTDILVRDGDHQAAAFLLHRLAEDLRGRRFSMFSVKKDARILQALVSLVNDGVDLDYELSVRVPTYKVDLAGGWQGYLAQKSPKFRKHTNQIFRKMSDLKFRFSLLDPESDLIREATRLYLEWNLQKMGERSVYRVDKNREFTLEAIPIMARKKMFRMYMLFDEKDVPKGVVMEACGKGIRMAYQYSFHPDLLELGAGRYLFLSAIKAAAEDGLKEYDMGRTTNPLKERIMTASQNIFTLNLSGINEESNEDESD
jgi:CelD/BcsL family acetyltransferase involved in cellulose biosynthesis